MHFVLANCGLQLVVDPNEKIRVIRRSKKKVGDKGHRSQLTSVVLHRATLCWLVGNALQVPRHCTFGMALAAI